MKIKILYNYVREDGGVTTSLKKTDREYTETYRLVADKGKLLTNGEISTRCIDVDFVDGWREIDAPPEEPEEPEVVEEATEADYINALAELGVTVQYSI